MLTKTKQWQDYNIYTMERIEVLIKKYGLSEEVAYHVHHKLEFAILLEADRQNPIILDKENRKAIELIKKAKPEKFIPVGEQSEKERIKADGTRSISIEGLKIMREIPKITKVSFRIGKKNVSFDDPVIIEMLRQRLCEDDIKPEPPKKANRPTMQENILLKELVEYLMEYSKYEGKESNYRSIAEIFGLYLKSWEAKSHQKLIESIYNLMR